LIEIELGKKMVVAMNLGPLHFFLGIEANHNNAGMCLTQTKYLTDLLERVNMINCKPCLSPMASGTILSSKDSKF